MVWTNVFNLPPAIDAAHLARQRAFSEKTFGPGPRTQGVLDHIRKELVEIEQAPDDLGEWIDVVILGLDGAWRAGHEPQKIIDAIIAKQVKNEARTWPDWKSAPEGKAIEHDRSGEQQVGFVSGQESSPTESIQSSYDHMEMPAPCSVCGEVQELNDFRSRIETTDLVCDACWTES